RMAADLPRNKYRTPRPANAACNSWAWRYSNVAIAQPRWEFRLTPPAIVGHPLERPEAGVVQHGLVRLDEGVAQPGGERPSGGGGKLTFPLPPLRLSRSSQVGHGTALR